MENYNHSEIEINNKSLIGSITSWFFGALFFAIGLVNLFWGNDPGFGAFIILLSFVFFPPVNTFTWKITGFSIPLIAKIILGLFILWAALGVGELPDKIRLMLNDL